MLGQLFRLTIFLEFRPPNLVPDSQITSELWLLDRLKIRKMYWNLSKIFHLHIYFMHNTRHDWPIFQRSHTPLSPHCFFFFTMQQDLHIKLHRYSTNCCTMATLYNSDIISWFTGQCWLLFTTKAARLHTSPVPFQWTCIQYNSSHNVTNQMGVKYVTSFQTYNNKSINQCKNQQSLSCFKIF